MIVIGVAALVALIGQRLSRMGAHEQPLVAEFGQHRLDVPTATELVSMQASGERLLLHMREPDGRERVLVLDLGSGEFRGSFDWQGW